ncbi:cytochrome b [Methylophaga sp. OBS4]|uniref:cytochrome b n=1 Tax=Methylophaga sp. OBS4 TaxID=2991935 RepID=UPI002253A7FD|nr:cytochrome b [Methylophaga sp. OBS4]MCX4188320.1 cytochrome b [Methylophaga sp. OBS4]
MKVSVDRYDRVQVVLHWLIAAIILFMIGLGLFMVQLPKESELPPGQESVRAFYFLLHKSLGLTAAILILFRLGWRLTHKAPPLPGYVPMWQQRASRGVHGLLYVLMVAIPLSGYLQSMFSKYDTKFWGIILPRMAEADEAMRETFSAGHEFLAFTLIALLLIHIAAVVKHRLAGNDIHKRISLFD